MKIYVVEDEMLHLEDILISLKQLNHNCVGHSGDPFEAQEDIKTLLPDVVLMDIHLGGKTAGITIAKNIKASLNIPVIFTSSNTDSSIIEEAIEAEPITYITKPVNEHDLNAALILASKKIKNTTETEDLLEEIFIKNGNKLVKVPIRDILYAHTDSKNYCTIVTLDSKLSVRNSISGLKELLNHDTFIQTHRSYIINWKKVDSVIESEQTIQINNHHIPLGRSYKQAVFKRLQVI